MPAAANTASKAAVNFESRSRMRNRNRWACSSRSISRLRAAWVTHAPVGWAVTPARWDPTVIEFDHGQDVQAGQPDGLDGEEIAGERSAGLRTRELRPSVRVP